MGGSKRKRNGRRNRASSEVTYGGERLVTSDPGPPQHENGNDVIGDPELEYISGSVNTTSHEIPLSHNSNSTGGSTKFHWALKAEKDVHADLKHPIIQTVSTHLPLLVKVKFHLCGVTNVYNYLPLWNDDYRLNLE